DRELLLGCGIEGCGEEEIVELANGCICCTVAEDFIPTMTRLLERDAPPDHIVIETSGLALPQPLIRAFNWPDIRAAVTVDGVVAVIDGPAVRDGLFAADPRRVEALRRADVSLDHESPLHELFEDQLRAADLVVLNKADRLTAAERDALSGRLAAAVRPGVAVLPATHGRLSPDVLLGLAAAAEDDVHNRPTHHELEGEADHDHDDFVSFAIDLPPQPDRDALLSRVRRLMEDQPAVLRLKGFAVIDGRRARFAVQAVGPRVEGWFDRPLAADEPAAARLVVIGLKGLDRNAVREALLA
ncbi:MAG TPA: cobalamin biosynthesis protein CobW, partial [Thermopetrobacter sp.]|nr:cobalamin biosynthesis protein CobW [Thermopetrobacter sp.]